MKTIRLFLCLLSLTPATPLPAAVKEYPVRESITVIREGERHRETRRQSYGFTVEVVGDEEGSKAESWRDGRPFVAARAEERYAVRLHNPLPVRVAVNLTVDGINSITGKPSGIEDGAKWIIEP